MIESNINEKEIRSCYKFLSHEKESEVRLIDPHRKSVPMSIFVHSEDEFFEACKKYNGKYNVYIGINERKLNGTETLDVLSVKTLVIDIDAVRSKGFEKDSATEGELYEAEKDCDNLIRSMVKTGLPEPIKLHTGNGFQVWIAIPEIKVDNGNRKEIQEKLHLFQNKIKQRYENFGGFDNIGDLPRIIKVWGTLNIKGKNTKERPFRVAKVTNHFDRVEDITTKKILIDLKIEKDVKIEIVPIEKLNKEFIPAPIKYLLFDYKHASPEGWMRIIETLASFLRGIGLNKEKTSGMIIDWTRKQSYREDGEEREAIRIVNRIYKNEIMCPNFEKIVDTEAGYPFFGLADKFKGVDLGDKWKQYKNPIQYYKTIGDEKKDIKLRYLNFISGKDKSWPAATELLTKHIMSKIKIYTTKDDQKSEMWIYQEGIYVPQGKSEIRIILRELLEEHYSSFVFNQVIAKLEPDTFIEPDEFFKTKYKYEIPVKNGILDVSTLELKPFTEEKIFFSKMPVKFDQSTNCPKVDQFLKDILSNEEDIKVFYEIVGFCLLKDYTFEKAFMLVGWGRNGKSKSIELIKRLLGMENCCSIPLGNLVPESFSISELFGKLVNIAGDINNKDLQDTSLFKSLTGRDLVGGKRKYLNDLYFQNYAKFIFACNDLPMVYDQSRGFWSRWILLDYPYTFVTQEEYNKIEDKSKFKIKDDEIIEKISTPIELSGFLNQSLMGLQRLFENKDFSSTKGSEEIKSTWIRRSNSFLAFCHDDIIEDSEGIISKAELRKKYFEYCKRHKVGSKSDFVIKRTLQDAYGVSEDRHNFTLSGSNYQWVWLGIKWKENDEIKQL